MQKRGISPLIATVLLVAFSVALGAVVMNFTEESTVEWSGQAEREINRGITCNLDMIVKLHEVDGEPFICYNRSGTENLEFIAENQGSASAYGMHVIFLDALGDSSSYTIESGLEAHAINKYNISLEQPVVYPPTKVIISPMLSKIDVCDDIRIETETVFECD